MNTKDSYLLIIYSDFEGNPTLFLIPKSNTKLYNMYENVNGLLNGMNNISEETEKYITYLSNAIYTKNNPNHIYEDMKDEISTSLISYITTNLDNLNIIVSNIRFTGEIL